MSDHQFHLLAGLIFGVVAILQAVRIARTWTLLINGHIVPMWVSWVVLIVAGGLSYIALVR